MTKPVSTPTFAIISSLPVILGCALLGATEARADYFVTIDQVGSSVVATGSGSINTSGLGTPSGDFTGNEPATIAAGNGRLQVGFGPIDFWSGVALSGPPNFGSGVSPLNTTGSGNSTGIFVLNGFLSVPLGYSSNAPLGVSTATWSGMTFANLGITPGTSDTWTWGSGAGAGSFTISVVPGPIVGAGLPGLIAALGGLVAMARRRRKQLA